MFLKKCTTAFSLGRRRGDALDLWGEADKAPRKDPCDEEDTPLIIKHYKVQAQVYNNHKWTENLYSWWRSELSVSHITLHNLVWVTLVFITKKVIWHFHHQRHVNLITAALPLMVFCPVSCEVGCLHGLDLFVHQGVWRPKKHLEKCFSNHSRTKRATRQSAAMGQVDTCWRNIHTNVVTQGFPSDHWPEHHTFFSESRCHNWSVYATISWKIFQYSNCEAMIPLENLTSFAVPWGATKYIFLK